MEHHLHSIYEAWNGKVCREINLALVNTLKIQKKNYTFLFTWKIERLVKVQGYESGWVHHYFYHLFTNSVLVLVSLMFYIVYTTL